MSNHLNRGVYAHNLGVYFSSYTNVNDPYVSGDGPKAPVDLPVYAVPEGAPHQKPNNMRFTPQHLTEKRAEVYENIPLDRDSCRVCAAREDLDGLPEGGRGAVR